MMMVMMVFVALKVMVIDPSPSRRWIDNNRDDMSKYELTADMTENRQYLKMMVKTGPQRSGDGL